MPRVTIERARAAKSAARRRFAKLGTVVAVGLTRVGDDYAVKINMDEPLPPGTRAPARIDGVRVCVEVTGTARARSGQRGP